MNKLITISTLVLMAQFSFADHHELGHMNKAAVIGYEISDDGKRTDLLAGNMSNIKLWVDYVEAHNQRDLEAIRKTNADDFEGRAPNGAIIKGPDAHIAFLEDWFAASNPSWEYNFAIANDVPQSDGTVHHWVTSSYTVTQTIDGKEMVTEEMIDTRIENNKVKYILAASRLVPAEEE